jgi:hypothetical protein
MSRGHVTFKRKSSNGEVARYELWAEDFSPGPGEQGLAGEMVIDVAAKMFQVIPFSLWLEYKVFPPHLFFLGEDRAREMLSTTHKGYDCWAFSKHIHRFAMQCFASGDLPEAYHGAF